MTTDQRLEVLEKKVAELERQLLEQPMDAKLPKLETIMAFTKEFNELD